MTEEDDMITKMDKLELEKLRVFIFMHARRTTFLFFSFFFLLRILVNCVTGYWLQKSDQRKRGIFGD